MEALSTVLVASSLDLFAAGVESMETLENNIESIFKIYDVQVNGFLEAHSIEVCVTLQGSEHFVRTEVPYTYRNDQGQKHSEN